MNCNVANDLIPLYIEGLCSDATAAELKEHFDNCPECSKKLADAKKEIPTVSPPEITPKKAFGKVRIYIVVSAVFIGITILFGGMFGIYRQYVNTMGYLKADEVFHGQDAQTILKNTENVFLGSIWVQIADTNAIQAENQDIGLDEFNKVRKDLHSAHIDYSTVRLTEDSFDSEGKRYPNCAFTISGMITCDGKYNSFDINYKRIGAGKYYAVDATVLSPNSNLGYSQILPEGSVYEIDIQCDATKEINEELGQFIKEDYPPIVYYSYADDSIDGVYTSEDGKTITFENHMLKTRFHKEPDKCNLLDVEIVYPDHTEYKQIIEYSGFEYSGLYPEAGLIEYNSEQKSITIHFDNDEVYTKE